MRFRLKKDLLNIVVYHSIYIGTETAPLLVYNRGFLYIINHIYCIYIGTIPLKCILRSFLDIKPGNRANILSLPMHWRQCPARSSGISHDTRRGAQKEGHRFLVCSDGSRKGYTLLLPDDRFRLGFAEIFDI